MKSKLDDLVNPNFSSASDALYARRVEENNKLVKQFMDTRSHELANYQGLEAAIVLVQELTGRSREDILEKEIHGRLWNHKQVVEKTEEYSKERKQADMDAGII